jgi:hypothetical protein
MAAQLVRSSVHNSPDMAKFMYYIVKQLDVRQVGSQPIYPPHTPATPSPISYTDLLPAIIIWS